LELKRSVKKVLLDQRIEVEHNWIPLHHLRLLTSLVASDHSVDMAENYAQRDIL
jgi:hypothetical protein